MPPSSPAASRPDHGLGILLYQLFKKLNAAAAPNPNNTIQSTLMAALAIQDERTLLRTLDTLNESIDRFEVTAKDISDLPSDAKKLLIDLFRGMRYWVSVKFLAKASSEAVRLTADGNLNYLLFVARQIEQEHPEPAITQDDFEVIAAKMADLQNVIQDATVPENLKAMLTNLVGRMRWAVENYGLLGVTGLVREVTSAQITLVHIAALDEDTSNSGIRPWFSKAWLTISSIGKLCSSSLKIYEAGEKLVGVGKELKILS